MAKLLKPGIFAVIILLSAAAFAQISEPKREFNPLYSPLSIIQRLSYDNFKKIKLLHTAIMNFGGGEAEFNRLVDEYAEASALYFRESIIESANVFTRNERNIDAVGATIAAKYKTDVESLHDEIIKMNVKKNITRSLTGEKANPTADLLVSNAGFAVRKASDYIARSKSIDAIYYYRRAKENCFKYYEVTGQPLPERYKRDILDNQNKIYVEKEKEK